MSTSDENVPVVFISYSHTSEEHKSWVLQMAEDLVGQRVDVRIDVWELSGGQDVIDFMEGMVKNPEIDRVLIICERGYKEKADSRSGGAGIESQIISPNVYGDVKQDKFIPVLRERDEEGGELVPIYLEGRFYVDFSDEEKYGEKLVELVRTIYGKREHIKPPLGPRPAYLDEEELVLPTAGQWASLRSAIMRDSNTAQGQFDLLIETYITSFDQFTSTPSDLGGKDLEDYVIDKIGSMTPLRDHFVEILDFISLYKDERRYYEKVHSVFERLYLHTLPPITVNSGGRREYDSMKFFLHEMFLYTVTILKLQNRFEQASLLLEEEYFIDHPYERRSTRSFDCFYSHTDTLEILRKQKIYEETRKKPRSVTADMLYSRGTIPGIPFRDLLETDFVLSIRNPRWYPILMIYWKGESFPIFQRAGTERGFRNLSELLGVSNKADFVNKINEIGLVSRLQKIQTFIDLEALVSLESMYDS